MSRDPWSSLCSRPAGAYAIGAATLVGSMITIISLIPEQYRFLIAVTLFAVCFIGTGWLIGGFLTYKRRSVVTTGPASAVVTYPDRARLKDMYRELVRHAQERVMMLGISLHTFCTTPEIGNVIKESLASSHSAGLVMEFILLDSHCSVLRQRENEENRTFDRIGKDCRQHREDLLRWRQELGVNERARMGIYCTGKNAPIGFLMIVDNTLFFQPYLYQFVGRTCPMIEMSRNNINADVFDAFVKHFKNVRKTASPVTRNAGSHFRITEAGSGMKRADLHNAVFLDRDGVINRDVHYLCNPSEFSIYPDCIAALKRLQKFFRIIVVTNQSGIARGYMDISQLDAIHERMIEELDEGGALLDAIYYCPHHPTDGVSGYTMACNCRKPKPGMLHAARDQFTLDLGESFMIGDKESDIDAGLVAGVRATIRIQRSDEPQRINREADQVFDDLSAAADWILNNSYRTPRGKRDSHP